MSARKVLCIYSVLEASFFGDVDCMLYSSVLNGWLGAAAVSHAYGTISNYNKQTRTFMITLCISDILNDYLNLKSIVYDIRA